MRSAIQLGLMLFAAAALGCGSGTGTLSGTVEYKGRKLAQGTVQVVSESGVVYSAQIQPDGSDRIENCPTGRVKIAVFSPNPATVAETNAARTAMQLARGRTSRPTPAAGDPSTWIEIPELFSSPDKSGLTAEVSIGENVHPIMMD